MISDYLFIYFGRLCHAGAAGFRKRQIHLRFHLSSALRSTLISIARYPVASRVRIGRLSCFICAIIHSSRYTRVATPEMSQHPQHHLAHLHAQPSGELPFSRPQTPHKDLVVGFCGLGAMGHPMARNLANRLATILPHSPLHVYNRTRSKSEKLLEELGQSKIKITEKPEDLALECDIIISNLANDEVVKQTFEKLIHALKVCVLRRMISSHSLSGNDSAAYPKYQEQDLCGNKHCVPYVSW